MPEIGNTLREARMRQRLDITDMEVRTKIRAKYLRALENEEWDLLPGPTYVKSFLRTYAEALSLDPKLLVEEYKLRHERLETSELQPIRPAGSRDRSRRNEPRRGFPRGVLVGLVLLLIFGALFLIGQRSATDEAADDVPPATTTGKKRAGARKGSAKRRGSGAASRVVRLTIAPTAPVWVCLESAGGRRLIGGRQIAPGTPRTFRSRRFRITVGNSSVRLRVNGRAFTPSPSAEPQGFEFTRNGRRTLDQGQRPTCSPTT